MPLIKPKVTSKRYLSRFFVGPNVLIEASVSVMLLLFDSTTEFEQGFRDWLLRCSEDVDESA